MRSARQVWVLPTHDAPRLVEVAVVLDDEGSPPREWLYSTIECELVQLVSVDVGVADADLWVDEEGLCKPNMLNPTASTLCGVPIAGVGVLVAPAGVDVRRVLGQAFRDGVLRALAARMA